MGEVNHIAPVQQATYMLLPGRALYVDRSGPSDARRDPTCDGPASYRVFYTQVSVDSFTSSILSTHMVWSLVLSIGNGLW